ncbi:MAG: hypothetical protein MJ151_02955, partial [Lachnospiraceae bacterium]|nr:hypothetical protein [Lachnospiraceae bacterium]
MIQKASKKNDKKKIQTLCFEGLFVLMVVMVLFIPLFLYFTGYQNNLSGVEYKVATPSFTIEGFIDNTYQDNVDKYLEQNLPGKDIAVNFRNQLLYDMFKISPHKSIDIGVDDTLFFEETIDYYCHGLYNVSDEYMDNLMSKFEELNNICDETGKKLVIVLTPTKPRYYEDKIPTFDKMMVDINKVYGKDPVSYDKFREKLEKSNILYFDSIDYINKNRDKLDTKEHPLWMKGGHHWTMYQGRHVGIALEDFIINYTEPELP